MNILLTCLLIAVVMPIVAKAPLAWAMAKQGRYDNRLPRLQQQQLQGFGARAKAAHENSFEALIMFTPGVLALVATGKITDISQYFAIGFVLARVGYLICYWFNQDKLRSLLWMAGFGLSVALLVQAI